MASLSEASLAAASSFTPSAARRAPRRAAPVAAMLAMVAALGLGACSTTDGTGGTGESSGQASGVAIDRSVSGRQLNADQLREALAREGVTDRVLFGYDSAELTGEARATIEKWARILNQASGTRVVIEGHCDERGTREYNLALGERRATMVRNYLTSIGVPAARIQTLSYGKEKPVVVASNEQSWAQNRRGVLVID
jgi:peptidoglycan-associated lipoprotein